MAPWADALYACDQNWWELRGPTKGQFKGLRFIGKGTWKGCTSCNVSAGDNYLRLGGNRLGAGGNSGFQALNLALVAGGKKIILTGYDMKLTERTHWHGDHESDLNNPTKEFLRSCAVIMNQQASIIKSREVEVINATLDSAIEAYPKIPLREALNAN